MLSFYRGMFLILAMLLSTQAQATNTWSGFKAVTELQAVEHGGFLITFSTPLESPCAQSGANRVYVYPDQQGVTASGLKTLYATAMLAFATGKQINVMYDYTSTNCWVGYIRIQ